MTGIVEQAARNNAAWCDAVCRAHGCDGTFHPDLWLNPHRVPRHYPNVVTLRDQLRGQMRRAVHAGD